MDFTGDVMIKTEAPAVVGVVLVVQLFFLTSSIGYSTLTLSALVRSHNERSTPPHRTFPKPTYCPLPARNFLNTSLSSSFCATLPSSPTASF